MAILGVKVQLHMIVTGPQGTLGSSTSPWSTYTYAAPALAGTGARTDVDADNTYTFSVDGINFGAEEVILEQCAAIDRVVHPEHGRVYWRCNPGKKDHGNTACEDIDFFPWNFDLLNYYAYKNNFKCYDLQKDGRRLYSEWRRHST